MTPRVTVYVSPDHDLYHTSLFLSGLCAIEGRGDIDLTYRQPRGGDRWLTADPVVVCLDVEGEARRRIAVDLRDGEGVSGPILDRVDRYLKRAFYTPERDRLPPALAEKMEPFGLNFGMRTGRSTTRLLRAIGWSLVRQGRPGLQKIRQFLWTPTPAVFEQRPDVAVEPKVAFQTRLWTAREVPPDEVEPLNAGRVAMVRALKAAFGDRFVGGLMATPLALERYPARRDAAFVEVCGVSCAEEAMSRQRLHARRRAFAGLQARRDAGGVAVSRVRPAALHASRAARRLARTTCHSIRQRSALRPAIDSSARRPMLRRCAMPTTTTTGARSSRRRTRRP